MDKGFQRRVFLNFTFFLLIIFAYYIAKPIRNSLFLESMGPAQLPIVYIISSLVSLVSAAGFERLLSKSIPPKIVSLSLAFFSVVMVMFWAALSKWTGQAAFLAFGLYVFISFFAVAAVTLFWATRNDSFTEEEGKRAYGYIGIGGILGGLLGGKTTQLLAPILGTENLLLLSAGILCLTFPLPFLTAAAFYGPEHAQAEQFRPSTSILSFPQGLRLIIQNRYVLSIAGIVFFTTFAGTLFDFQYQTIINGAGLAKDLRTALFAQVFYYVNLAGIVVHLLLTKRLLRRFGPIGGLLPLPFIALAASFYLPYRANLGSAIVLWTIMGGIGYSLNQVARESLYIPTGIHIKYGAKAYIDTFVFRAGDAGASTLLLAYLTWIKSSTLFFICCNAFGALAWLSFVFYLRRRYFYLPKVAAA
ncbi:MAG: hypothetical protein HY611_05345 [Elusimicrobia bacterium]|nr:hypothetical protein [Elusimicrobiota bacterium]